MTADTDRIAVVAGEALIDLVVARDGSLNGHPGGGPYNVARGGEGALVVTRADSIAIVAPTPRSSTRSAPATRSWARSSPAGRSWDSVAAIWCNSTMSRTPPASLVG